MRNEKDEAERMVRDLMQKNKRLAEERDDLNEQMKGLMVKLNALKEEAEGGRIAAEAANKDKANVEKDWSTRLIRARSHRLAARGYSQRASAQRLSRLQTEKEWAIKMRQLQDDQDAVLDEKAAESARKLAEAAAAAEATIAATRAENAAARQRLGSEHAAAVADLTVRLSCWAGICVLSPSVQRQSRHLPLL